MAKLLKTNALSQEAKTCFWGCSPVGQGRFHSFIELGANKAKYAKKYEEMPFDSHCIMFSFFITGSSHYHASFLTISYHSSYAMPRIRERNRDVELFGKHFERAKDVQIGQQLPSTWDIC